MTRDISKYNCYTFAMIEDMSGTYTLIQLYYNEQMIGIC